MACLLLAASTTFHPPVSHASGTQLHVHTSGTQLRVPPAMMGDCAEQGFNSFRRWPTYSQNAVSLTNRARSFFGLTGQEEREFKFEEICAQRTCDLDVLEKLMKAMPLPDQRGERVLLDVDAQGQLGWRKMAA